MSTVHVMKSILYSNMILQLQSFHSRVEGKRASLKNITECEVTLLDFHENF